MSHVSDLDHGTLTANIFEPQSDAKKKGIDN